MRAVVLVKKDGKVEKVEGDLVEVSAGPGELWAAAASGGDANQDKRADVTLCAHLKLPVLPDVRVPATTKNIPVEEALTLAVHAGAAVSGVPGLGPTVAAGIKGLVGLLRALMFK